MSLLPFQFTSWSSYAYLACILLTSIFVLILLVTRFASTVRHRRAISKFIYGEDDIPHSPPPIPYTIPFLGHAHKYAWMNTRVGEFWKQLFGSYGRIRPLGAFTLLLGGQPIHILSSAPAIEAVFKIKNPNRLGFALQIVENVLGVSKEQFTRHLGFDEEPDPRMGGLRSFERLEEITRDYLLKKDAVNELTTEFMASLERELQSSKVTGEVGLIEWLQPIMFRASINAVFGMKLMETYPQFESDFFAFDQNMQALFFGGPKFLNAEPHRIREKCLGGLERWHKVLAETSSGDIPSATSEPAWDPSFGSRYNRARQEHHNIRGMTLRSKAGLDLGFCLALGGNAIPATLWMLLHILDPNGDPTLLPRMLTELRSAKNVDGTLDVPKVLALPLLQSVYEEVLRLYMDSLVTRNLQEDVSLPLDDKGRRKILLRKDETVMVPAWISHRDDDFWNTAPADQFFADRFLVTDYKTGDAIFSTAGSAGRLFPYGGGKTMCPGRVFAKQEMLVSVAHVLLKFNVRCRGFTDGQGNATANFPKIRDALIGSVMLSAEGDMQVNVSSRES